MMGDTVVKFLFWIFFILILNGCSGLELFIMNQKAITRGNALNNKRGFQIYNPRNCGCNSTLINRQNFTVICHHIPTINQQYFRVNNQVNYYSNTHTKKDN